MLTMYHLQKKQDSWQLILNQNGTAQAHVDISMETNYNISNGGMEPMNVFFSFCFYFHVNLCL